MSKKQRVKGKGADIFFSDEQAEETEKTEDKEQQSREVLEARLKSGRPRYTGHEELATKATFYFRKSQLDALEKAVFLLKQEYRKPLASVAFCRKPKASVGVCRIKTNKSEVMRIALDEIIKEFEEKQKESALFLRLAYRPV